MKKKQNVNLIGRCYCCKNNIREMRLYQRDIVFVSSTPAPDVGLEPTTTRLKVLRSTDWANRVVVEWSYWELNPERHVQSVEWWPLHHKTPCPTYFTYIHCIICLYCLVIIYYPPNLKENILGFEFCVSAWYFCFNFWVNFDLKHGRLSLVFI